MLKSISPPLLGLSLAAIAGCTTHNAGPDVGPLIDVAPSPFDAGPPPGDAGPVSTVNVRLVNLIPASADPHSPGGPNLTVCLATIPGTGVASTTAHILGSPQPPVSDGTLPSPGVSPYLTVPVFSAPGFGYQLRLYDRAALPFSSLGVCPDQGAAPAPLVSVTIDGSMVTDGGHYTLALIGVLPGSQVSCTGPCPPVQARVFPDSFTMPPPHQFRARLFQGIPNLPGPIHVCVDPLYTSPTSHGSEQRILPPAGMPGLAFGEVTQFVANPRIDPAMGSIQGAIYTHLSVSGLPDCDPSTLLQGPVTIPLPVPASAPIDVARTFKSGDVITNFAFGRVGATCTTASDCVSPTSVCVMHPCTCDATHHCVDDLAGNTLPWRDVRGDAPVDAGPPDAGADGG